MKGNNNNTPIGGSLLSKIKTRFFGLDDWSDQEILEEDQRIAAEKAERIRQQQRKQEESKSTATNKKKDEEKGNVYNVNIGTVNVTINESKPTSQSYDPDDVIDVPFEEVD